MGILTAALDLLFPPKCIFCRKVLRAGRRVCCPDCLEKLAGQTRWRQGVFFSRCCVPLVYEGDVREAVIRFKFKDQPGYATEFGRILGQCIGRELKGQYDLITWIPVSEERLKKRGYDQAMLLAMAAALELGDVAVETLKKAMDNAAQSSLEDAEARKSNVLGAYRVEDPMLVEGKRVLLIDDIVTTGATLDEASRTLLEAGAKEVIAAALAQPPEHINDPCEVSL